MRSLAGVFLIAVLGTAMVGCSGGEVSNQDQAAKMSALHKAEQASQAKDGVKSE